MNGRNSALPVEAGQDLHIFRRCLPLQLSLQESLRFLEEGGEDRVCLDIGAGNAVVSYHLRKKVAGEWHTVPSPGQNPDTATTVLESNVHTYEGGALPFEDKVFDVLIVFEALLSVPDPESFIAECHRVMKPDGRLILHAARAKRLSLLRPIRKMLRVSYDRRGLRREGYTESDLFSLLKHGFDVYQVRSYSRFFVELTHAIVQALIRRGGAHSAAYSERTRRIFSVANVFYRLGYQFDMLMFFAKGHHLVAMAKRRAWRPRKAPILVDGRSITEVVLSRAAR